MKLIDRLLKRAAPTSAIAVHALPEAKTMERSYRAFAQEGYQQNVVAFSAIGKVAQGVATVHLCLKRKRKGAQADEEIYDHPILTLLEKPNMMQNYQSFTENAIAFMLLSGNSFIHGVGPSASQPPKELYNIRPDRMSVLPGQFRIPSAYIYQHGATKQTFPVDQFTGDSAIMHMKTFNPLDDWNGMSPLEAAAKSVDSHNASSSWNLALIQNGARPSGAFIYTGEGTLTEEQRRFLSDQLDKQQSGPSKAGRPMLLSGGLDWKEMGFNPKDMDFIQGRHVSAREITLAYGVPPQLLGIPGDSTYSNYKEAKQAFYLDTVVPLAKMYAFYLNNWLVASFGDDSLYLEPDINAIEALEPMRAEKFTQVSGAGFLTINEKRELLGYGRYEKGADDADIMLVPIGQAPLSEVIGSDVDETVEPADPDAADDFEDTDEEPDDSPEVDEDEKSWSKFGATLDGKAVNLRSRTARERYRKEVIKRRQRLETRYETQLKAVWRKEASMMAEAVDGISVDLLEFVVEDVVSKNEPAMERVIRANIERIMRSFGEEMLNLPKALPGLETKADPKTRFESSLQQFIETHTASQIRNLSKTTKKRVVRELRQVFNDALTAGDTPNTMVNAVKEVYSGFGSSRAATVVRTEVGIAQNEAQRSAAKALGVPNMIKTWISPLLATSRENHVAVHETSVGINDKFEVPSKDGIDLMDGPGDPDAPGDQIINCHCVNVFGTGGNT